MKTHWTSLEKKFEAEVKDLSVRLTVDMASLANSQSVALDQLKKEVEGLRSQPKAQTQLDVEFLQQTIKYLMVVIVVLLALLWYR